MNALYNIPALKLICSVVLLHITKSIVDAGRHAEAAHGTAGGRLTAGKWKMAKNIKALHHPKQRGKTNNLYRNTLPYHLPAITLL